MVQREVANEMAASPGDTGLMSLGVQMYADVEKLFEVPPSAFRPPPKVTSAVVRLTVLPQPRVAVDSEAAFFSLVRAGFRAPRKQLRNSLALGLGVPLELAAQTLARAGIEASRRPSTLSLEEWGLVYRMWHEMSPVARGAAQ
jgi:16S rRNA (adenine1518-N6/adenine1519-N6)-dimethyltransferase